MNKLKKRWGVTSNFQLIIILVVFTINGSLSAYLMKPVLGLLGITKDHLAWYFYWPLASILILPVYLVLLATIGTIFGQGYFFQNFAKKTARKIGFKFLFPEKTDK